MIVRDNGVWQLCKSELLVHGPAGEEMLDFIDFWAEAAEVVIERGKEFAQEDGTWTGVDPAEALRQALPVVEARFGQVNISAIAQGLIVIMGNWVHGEPVFPHLTVFEQVMVSDTISIKQMELAKAAQVAPT